MEIRVRIPRIAAIPSSSESDDRHPLLGNEYLMGSPNRRQGLHSLFTPLSINGVIAADLHPNQLPHSIHDTPPPRLVVSQRGIIEHVPPPMGTTLNLGMVADMKADPRLEQLSVWGKPILSDGGVFGLPAILGKGKRKGKGREARGNGSGSNKYRELPSVAAHSPWSPRTRIRDDDDGVRADRDGAEGHTFERYRELPSVAAHTPWCPRTRVGDDDGVRADRDGAEGYTFERYRELPSVHAHEAWCARDGDGDDQEMMEEKKED